MSTEGPAILITDACVLIDYAKAGRLDVVELVSRKYLPVATPVSVFKEVNQLSEADASQLGIRLLRPTIAQLTNLPRGGPLSRRDKLCCAMAADMNGAVWSSDKPMWNHCVEQGIRFFWGLEIMLQLVEQKLLPKQEARAVGQTIHQADPKHITVNILTLFEQKLSDL